MYVFDHLRVNVLEELGKTAKSKSLRATLNFLSWRDGSLWWMAGHPLTCRSAGNPINVVDCEGLVSVLPSRSLWAASEPE